MKSVYLLKGLYIINGKASCTVTPYDYFPKEELEKETNAWIKNGMMIVGKSYSIVTLEDGDDTCMLTIKKMKINSKNT